MKRVLFLVLTIILTLTGWGKNESTGVAEVIKNSIPGNFKVENSVNKKDEVSINDILIRYGLSGKDINKPYYGYECDAVSKLGSIGIEVISFYDDEEAQKSIEYFSDGYSKHLAGVSGLVLGRNFNVKKEDIYITEIPCKLLKYSIDGEDLLTVALTQYNYLIVLSYPLSMSTDAETIIIALSKALGQVSVQDAKNTGRTYMEVLYTPSCFSDQSDTVTIKVTVFNPDNYKGKKPLEKFILLNTKTNKQIDTKLFGTGSAEFSIFMPDPEESKYYYTIICGDYIKDIEIPVLVTGIETEYNKLNDILYKGVVSDGYQTIKIKLHLSGMNNGTLEILQPEIGKIKSRNFLQNKKIRNPGDTIELEYFPPKYIDGELENETISGTSIYYKSVHLEFKYSPDNGVPVNLTIDLKVYKPPVIIMASTDKDLRETDPLADYLKSKNFAVYQYNDEGFNDPFEITGEKTAAYLQTIIDQWNHMGIKMSATDVIAYGVSGVTVRNYINTSALYRNNVRKLILVAVPNHGFNENQLNTKRWDGMNTTLKKQLEKGSDFLNKLNSGEYYAGHINAMIQYANLSAYSGKPFFMEGDGVVSLESAYMNGVEHKTYWQLAHSEDLAGSVSAILKTEEVHSDILMYLSQDITPGRLRHMKVLVSKVSGTVTVSGPTDTSGINLDSPNIKLPYIIDNDNSINTYEGKAIVQIYLDSLLVSEVFLDEYSSFTPGGYCDGIIYGHIKKGNVYVKNTGKSIRNVIFFTCSAGSHKISLQNSSCLVYTEVEPKIACLSGEAFISLHEQDITTEIISVKNKSILNIKTGLTEPLNDDTFNKQTFYKRSPGNQLDIWKFYFVDTFQEFKTQIVNTGDIGSMFRHNRRLLTPVIIIVLAVALFFAAISNRKIRIGVVLIIIVISAMVFLPKIL